MDVRNIGRVGNGMPSSDLSCGNEVKSFYRSVLQSSDEVFLLVTVFFVDTLSIHHLGFVAELAVVGLSEDGKSEVTTILHTHERVAAATCQIGHAL